MKRKILRSEINWAALSTAAWVVRKNSHLYGKTKVGAALLSEKGKIYVGCNVEHIFRSHDIHAEVNAIGNMISGGDQKLLAILIVAQRNRFTPCGSCLDWIFQFGTSECFVGFQKSPKNSIKIYTAGELMPHYPF